MNNIGLMKYEIKRIVWSKKYLYILLLIAATTYDSLTRLVINGYLGTAPFSQWTYAFFISMISPVLMASMIFIVSDIFNEKEIRVRSIIYSSPISQIQYYMLKSSSVFVIFILTSLVPIFMSFIYYKAIFGYSEFGSFIKFIIVFLLPTFIFLLGLSMILGKINGKLIYVLIPITFLMGMLNFDNIIPIWADIFGNNFLSTYSYMMLLGRKTEAVAFKFPSSFIFTRLELIILGIIFLVYTFIKTEKK
ncbi:MAG: hypothetical protein E7205_04835 [Tissierellaceae bacterium]|nr:hypothetical protein [Tissierellaceae bacterium]